MAARARSQSQRASRTVRGPWSEAKSQRTGLEGRSTVTDWSPLLNTSVASVGVFDFDYARRLLSLRA
jgi:hypothetical protein